MKSEDPIGIIELGNINLKCIIFKIDKENNLEILSTAINPSAGIRNDVVVNLKKASDSIRSIISEAEKNAKISIKKVNVIFEQPDFLGTNFSKKKKIDGSKIKRHDIEFLLREGKKQLILNDKTQSIIHIFNHNYIVDGKIFTEEPIDVFADTLSHEMTFITAPKNNLKNINQTFIDCDIEIERLVSKTFALGVKLLSVNQLQLGSALINLESEKISLGIFKNLALVYSTTLPFGINDIIRDVSKVCSLTIEESQKIINNIDFSFQNNQNLFDENNFLKSFYFKKTNFRKISKVLILGVAKERIDEIFEILKKQLSIPRFNFNSGTDFLLTGKGINLFNLKMYIASFFNLDIAKIHLYNHRNADDLEKDFISCLGALKIIKDGWETEAIPKNKEKNADKISFFSKIFGHN